MNRIAALALLCLSTLPATAQQLPEAELARIDAVFSAFGPRTPGCSLALVREGKTLLTKGYGLADVAHGVPITPDTVFDIGSVAKQFTALALLLLERDGKLRLDDPLQKHLPELAAVFPEPVSLRELLQHTAGLPDYGELLSLAGVAEENVSGDADALRVLRAQPGLQNFAPGTRWSYSNTGYFLAGQVVQRVSGQSLDAFLQARVFKPLGMRATHVRSDHTQVVPQRASAYRPLKDGGGWALQMSNWNQTADGAVQSTAKDMALWLHELSWPQVLPPRLLARLSEPGRLRNGEPISYGLGLRSSPYRDLPRISHGGTWGGYRAQLQLYPAQQLGIALSCNAANANPEALAARLADALLAAQLRAPASLPPPAQTPPGFDAQHFIGSYLHADGHVALRIEADAEPGLRMHIGFGSSPLRAATADALQNLSGSLLLRREADAGLRLLRRDDPGRSERYTRLPAYTPAPELLAALTGRYRHAGLGSRLSLRMEAEGLRVQINDETESRPLRLITPDLLAGPGLTLQLERDAAGKLQALVYRSERVRGLRYLPS